jgi:2,4-dichlorophenol 6-monooxygenase
VADDGVVLVRPDMHVAWRSDRVTDDPAGDLRRVLRQVLALD